MWDQYCATFAYLRPANSDGGAEGQFHGIDFIPLRCRRGRSDLDGEEAADEHHDDGVDRMY